MKHNIILIGRLQALVSAFLICLVSPTVQASNWGTGSNSFAGAPHLTVGSGLSNATNLETFSSESNEPGHRPNGAVGAGKTAWWRWTAPVNGFVCIHTLLTQDLAVSQPIAGTVLAVYTGNSLSTLTRVVANEQHWLVRENFYPGMSSVAFYAIQGTSYRVALDGRLPSSISASNKNVILQLRQIANQTVSRRAVWALGNRPEYAGSLTLRQSGPSAFSAVLTAGRRVFRFRGQYDIEGYFRGNFQLPTPRGELPVPPLHLEIDGVQSSGIKMHDGREIFFAGPFPQVSVFSAASPNPVAGNFTAIATSGYASARIAANGVARGSARVPDGSAVTFSAPLAASPGATQYFLTTHRLLRGGSGYWQLRSVVEDKGAQDDWFADGVTSRFYRAPAPGATYLPAGVNSVVLLFGGTYTPPASGTRPFGFLNPSGNGKLFLSGGELTVTVTEDLVWSSANQITVTASSNNTVLRFNPRTGLLTGSTRLPAEPLRTLRAMISSYNGSLFVSGLATGRTRPSNVTITPP